MNLIAIVRVLSAVQEYQANAFKGHEPDFKFDDAKHDVTAVELYLIAVKQARRDKIEYVRE